MDPIKNLGVDVAKETLGVFVCPSDAADKQLDTIKSKAQEWTSRAEDSKLRQRDVWFLVDHQLWPQLSYGLCSVEAPWDRRTGESSCKKVVQGLTLGRHFALVTNRMPHTLADETAYVFWS